MPRWASMIAALAPVGPAPTITTGTWVAVIASPHPVVLGAEVEGAVGGTDRGLDPIARRQVGAAAGLAAHEQLPAAPVGQQAHDALHEGRWRLEGHAARGAGEQQVTDIQPLEPAPFGEGRRRAEHHVAG